MSTARQEMDISDSTELLHLVEEIIQTGETRLLKRGDQALAILVPMSTSREHLPKSLADAEEHDTILNIIGIGASSEPTDIAKYEGEYIAEANMPTRQ